MQWNVWVITIIWSFNKWNVQTNVPQFAYLGHCLYVTSSWDSISGEKLFKNENDKNLTQKQIIWKKSFLLNENLYRVTTKID